MKILSRSCPLCGTDNHPAKQMLPGSAEWPMKQCGSCTMVYLEKAPDPAELFENLAWEKSSAAEHKRREKVHGLARKLSRLTRARLNLFPRREIHQIIERYAVPGRVLDVGCGTGERILKINGRYTPYGIEVSKALSGIGGTAFAARGGELINNDAFHGLCAIQDNFFTGITMRSFLEHDVTPLDTLRESWRTLNQGGILVIKVPNFACLNRVVRGKNWCGLRFPDHVSYFTPQTLTDMVGKAGFSIRKFNFFDKIPTSDNMWLIAAKT